MTAPVVHNNPRRELTLSEVASAPRSGAGGQLSTARAQDRYHITPGPALDELAGAIAAHLSPRAGSALAAWDRPDALATRTAFVVQAIAAAARCPLCPVELDEAARDG